MSELLDFTGKKDFEDLKFGKGYHLTQDDISVFKEDCRRINTIHNQMALEQCKIGLLLSELKAGKTWQSVINQKTGFAYLVHSFEDFCKDAFGFSGTKTYALMQIAKFVTSNSENEVHFIDEKYSEFSSSQLTELASVPTYKRHFFTADMTIEQMRFVKKYIETDEFLEDRQKENFDLLTYANNYAESKKKPKALPASNPDVLDGQLSLFPKEQNEEEDNSPEHQEYLKESEPWIELTDEKKEQAIKIALLDRVGTIRKQRIYEKYQQHPLQCEFVNFLKEEYGNSGWGVDGLQGSCDYKGYRIIPNIGDWVIFMTWEQVASRIVSLINTGEYFPEKRGEQEEEIFPISGKNELGEEIIEEEIERENTHDVDEYDELDEAQEDMRAEMETIEQEAEKSVSEETKGAFSESPQKRYKFTTRDEIRHFLEDYKNWDYRDDLRTPFGKVGYYCTLKNFDIINVLPVGGITNESLLGEWETLEEEMPLYFLHRAKYPNQPSIMVGKRQLENYLMQKRDVLGG